jgi:hypothetical protein
MKAAAIIVAHPDDEIIWAGGLLIQNPGWDWSILSLCRRDDADRSHRFADVCESLGVRGIIENLDDGNPLAPIQPRRDIGRRVLEHLGDIRWDMVVTHGANGEYGHPRHSQVHHEVRQLAIDGLLDCGELRFFAYEAHNPSGRCVPLIDANVLLPLTGPQLRRKKQIISRQYGYSPSSFECRACISPESFQSMQIAEWRA